MRREYQRNADKHINSKSSYYQVSQVYSVRNKTGLEIVGLEEDIDIQEYIINEDYMLFFHRVLLQLYETVVCVTMSLHTKRLLVTGALKYKEGTLFVGVGDPTGSDLL